MRWNLCWASSGWQKDNRLRALCPKIGFSRMQWEATVSNEENPNEKSRAIRARQRAIGRELRRMYDDVAQEPVPEDFLDLLQKIDQPAEGKQS